MKYDISIIIPTYNVEKYIEDALNCIINQSFKGSIEIVIIDDCSIDNTLSIIENFKKMHNSIPFKILKQEQNMRQGTARNRGVREAKGKYIFFLDADDLLHKDTLNKMYQKAELNFYDFVVCDWIYYNKNNKLVYINHDNFMLNDELNGKYCERLLEAVTYFTVNKLYNRDFLLRNNIEYGEGYIYEDYEFYVEVAQKASKIGIVHNPFYQVRINDDSTTKTNRKSMIHIESLIKAVESTIDKFDPRWDESYYHLYKYIVRKTMNYINERAPKGQKKDSLKKILNILNNKKNDYYVPNDLNPLYDFYFRKKYVQQNKIYPLILVDLFYSNKKLRKLISTALKIKRNLNSNLLSKINNNIIKRKQRSKQIKYSKLPIVHNSILFLGFDYRFEGNSKYFYNYLQEKNKGNYKLYFVTEDENIPLENRIAPKSEQFTKLFSQARIIVGESWIPLNLQKRNGQTWIQLWHGTPLKKMLFDSHERQISSKNIYHKRNKQKDILRWDYLLADSPLGKEKLSSSFAIEESSILDYGYPRVKWLRENATNEELKLKIRENLGLPKNKKIILYAPTWRDYNYKTDEMDLSYLLDIKSLNYKLNNEYIILDKGHNFDTNTKSKYSNYDVQELILISDIIISDYSSIIFDCLQVNKPFYLFINDFEKYSSERGVHEDIFALLKPFCVDEENKLVNLIRNIGSSYPIENYQKTKLICTSDLDSLNPNLALQTKIDEILLNN